MEEKGRGRGGEREKERKVSGREGKSASPILNSWIRHWEHAASFVVFMHLLSHICLLESNTSCLGAVKERRTSEGVL